MNNIDVFTDKVNSLPNANTLGKIIFFHLAVIVIAAMMPMAEISAEVDERALYELAPENSAFVRLINLTDQVQSIRLDESGLSVSGHCSASRYQPINAGNYTFQSDSHALTSTFDSNRAYSVVVDSAGLMLITDKMVQSRRKSLVSVYNFTSLSGLSVKTTNGQHSVFSQLSSGAYVFREINPVKVSLSIFSESEKLSDVDATVFERGVVSSLLLCDRDGSIATTWIRQ